MLLSITLCGSPFGTRTTSRAVFAQCCRIRSVQRWAACTPPSLCVSELMACERDSWDWRARLGSPTCAAIICKMSEAPMGVNLYLLWQVPRWPSAADGSRRLLFPVAWQGTQGWGCLRPGWNSLRHWVLPSSSYTDFSHTLPSSHSFPPSISFSHFQIP